MFKSVLRNGNRDRKKRHESDVMLSEGMFSVMNCCLKLLQEIEVYNGRDTTAVEINFKEKHFI